MQEKISRPSTKSDTKLACKFRDEFIDNLNMIAPQEIDDDLERISNYQMFFDKSMLPNNLSKTISMVSFAKILYCLGFIQTMEL